MQGDRAGRGWTGRGSAEGRKGRELEAVGDRMGRRETGWSEDSKGW